MLVKGATGGQIIKIEMFTYLFKPFSALYMMYVVGNHHEDFSIQTYLVVQINTCIGV